MSRPLNYSTVIPAAKTVGECQALLAEAGAASVAVHYCSAARRSSAARR